MSRTKTVGQSWFALLLTGYVDGLEPLDEFDVIFYLRHLGFQLLSVGFLRHGLCDQREALVLMVQLIPGLLQTLDTDTEHLQQAKIRHLKKHIHMRPSFPARYLQDGLPPVL